MQNLEPKNAIKNLINRKNISLTEYYKTYMTFMPPKVITNIEEIIRTRITEEECLKDIKYLFDQ